MGPPLEVKTKAQGLMGEPTWNAGAAFITIAAPNIWGCIDQAKGANQPNQHSLPLFYVQHGDKEFLLN
jgi:hypothetical protein